MTHCLDSWAVLSWLEGMEPAAGRVEEAMATTPVMSWINAGEVAHILERRSGPADARRVVQHLRRRVALKFPSEELVLEAARLKSRWPVAYADAFAVATALFHGATLLTGDPEILSGDPAWPTVDLRS